MDRGGICLLVYVRRRRCDRGPAVTGHIRSGERASYDIVILTVIEDRFDPFFTFQHTVAPRVTVPWRTAPIWHLRFQRRGPINDHHPTVVAPYAYPVRYYISRL